MALMCVARARRRFGLLGELALGSGRWQYLAEGLVGSASLGDVNDPLMHVSGRMLHGAAGVRWIARQFRPASEAGAELFFMGLGGVERFYFDDGERVLRGNARLASGYRSAVTSGPTSRCASMAASCSLRETT